MMPVGADSAKSPPISTDPSPALRREMAVIAASLGVREDTVVLETGTDGESVRISFVLQNEIPVVQPTSGVLPEEPVTFLYESANMIGVLAPLVLSGRDTFPRILGHLNPVPASQPASLCLARAGLQPIYDRYGVEGVIARLRSWMRDAMTGSLMADGWEPVPLPAGTSTRGGLLDASAFQEFAFKQHGEGGAAAGIAVISEPDVGDQVFVYYREYSAETPAHNSTLAKAIGAEPLVNKHRQAVPWVFIWPGDENPISTPVFGAWRNYRDMRQDLAVVGLADRLEQLAGSVLANGCDCKHSPSRKTLVVIIGVWRPVPLADHIFGLSADPQARRLEIKVFTLETELTGNLLDDSTRLRAVISNPLPEPKLFRWTAGMPALATAALIGNGALGSAIGDHLLRSGIEDLIAIDKDVMMPHNLARHMGEVADVYRPKVKHTERAAIRIAVHGLAAKVCTYDEDILKLSDLELTERLKDAALLIDATAAEPVRIRLTEFGKANSKQIARVEIYDRGRLGVQFVTGASGNPSLLDLYYSLCREALTDDAVAHWLFEESLGGFGVEQLQIGFGCSSPTTRMPNYVIAQHASAFLAAERAKALPIETGGYLYGGLDFSLKQIVIVEASDLPPNSTATATKLTLGAAGCTTLERRIARRTRGRLLVCGSWHSHPGSSAALSSADIAVMAKFRQVDQPNGTPTLLAVVADGGIEAHLEV